MLNHDILQQRRVDVCSELLLRLSYIRHTHTRAPTHIHTHAHTHTHTHTHTHANMYEVGFEPTNSPESNALNTRPVANIKKLILA